MSFMALAMLKQQRSAVAQVRRTCVQDAAPDCRRIITVCADPDLVLLQIHSMEACLSVWSFPDPPSAALSVELRSLRIRYAEFPQLQLYRDRGRGFAPVGNTYNPLIVPPAAH